MASFVSLVEVLRVEPSDFTGLSEKCIVDTLFGSEVVAENVKVAEVINDSLVEVFFFLAANSHVSQSKLHHLAHMSFWSSLDLVEGGLVFFSLVLSAL